MNRTLMTMAQLALDRALALDPQAGSVLDPLSGKRIAVHITEPGALSFMVRFAHDRIVLRALEAAQVHVEDVDVSISGSAVSLLALARDSKGLPSTAQVRVQGDIGLLQQARTVLARLRPDFDEPLARLLGDELAWPVARLMRHAVSGVRRLARGFSDDVKEYVGEESDLLAVAEEVQDFVDEVDTLRDSLERLEKRVARLSAQLQAGSDAMHMADRS